MKNVFHILGIALALFAGNLSFQAHAQEEGASAPKEPPTMYSEVKETDKAGNEKVLAKGAGESDATA